MSYQTVYYRMSPRTLAHLDIPIGYALEDTKPRQLGAGMPHEKSKGLGVVIGIVAGVMTAGVGYGMIAAAQGIGGALAGGAMMAGGVMSAVGAATGNKKLSRVGGVLSLAGGAYGAAFTSGGEFALGTGKESLVSEGARTAMDKVGSAFGSSLEKVSTASSSNTLSVAGSDASSVGVNTFGPEQTGILKGASTSSNALGVGDPASYTGVSPGTQAATNTLGTPMSVTGSPLNAANYAPGATQPTGMLEKAWSGFSDLAKTNGGGQVIGSVIQGMGQGGMVEQQAKVQSQQLSLLAQKYANDQAELQRQIKNMNNAGAIFYDPADPNAQKILAAAQAAGIQAKTLSVNPNAGVASPMTAFNQGATA